jgi:hypothetical protein
MKMTDKTDNLQKPEISDFEKWKDMGWAVLDGACLPDLDRKTLGALAIGIGRALKKSAEDMRERCAEACEESGTDYSGQNTEDYCAAKIRALRA